MKQYKKHPEFIHTLSIPPSLQQEYFRCCQYLYLNVDNYGEIPLQKLAMWDIMKENIGKHGITKENYKNSCVINVIPDLTEYARGFLDGYNEDFKPFINDAETLKEYIVNKACKGFSSLPRAYTPNGTYYPHDELYKTGSYEGERYKAWEIILQTPSIFESYFTTEKCKSKYKTETTTKQRIENQPNTSYEINESVISYVYEILNNDAFILSRAQFSTLVENADFSSIYGIMSKNKAKIKWMISCLSVCMNDTWYENAAKSINTTQQKCSGANAAEYIKNKLNKEKIKAIMKKKE